MWGLENFSSFQICVVTGEGCRKARKVLVAGQTWDWVRLRVVALVPGPGWSSVPVGDRPSPGLRSQVAVSSQLSALSNNEESVSHSRKLTGNPGWTVAQDWPRQTADNAGSQLHFSLRGRAEGLVCFLSSALKSLTSEQLRFLRGSFLNNFLHCLLQFFLSCRLLLPAEEEN